MTNTHDARYMAKLANKHHSILATGNASDLLTMTACKKKHTMRALANLAKYNGCYEQWQKIIKTHGIHWRQTDNESFDFFEKESITEMIEYVKQTMKILPADMANTFVTATMIGLRADEVCKAISLLKKDAQDYHNAKLGVLEHYKHLVLYCRSARDSLGDQCS